jgi:hypothetical protein
MSVCRTAAGSPDDRIVSTRTAPCSGKSARGLFGWSRAPWRSASRPIADWHIAIALVLAVVWAVAVGMAATIALGKNPAGPDRAAANAAGAPAEADGYVEGLERLGIVAIRGFGDPLRAPRPAACSPGDR